MSLPDATASAALGAAHVRPVWFAYLDFDTDPVRANSSGATLTPSGSGDADLDGQSFVGNHQSRRRSSTALYRKARYRRQRVVRQPDAGRIYGNPTHDSCFKIFDEQRKRSR